MREATRRARSSRTLAPVAVVAAAMLLTGCESSAEPGSDDGIDAGRMSDVAQDESASADDIVEAGSAVDAAASGGAVLVTYTVDQGTSEGRSAAAWRLYDAAGGTVATEKSGVTEEGAAFTSVVAVADGFLVDAFDGPEWHVGTDGVVEAVGTEGEQVTAQAGDVALGDGSTRLYRPSSRAVFTPAPPAPGNRQGWTVTDDGTQWLQRLGRAGATPFSRSTEQGTWEPAATYQPRESSELVNSLALTAVGELVVVPLTADRRTPDKVALEGLLVRRSTAPPGRPWDLVESPDDVGTGWFDARTATVDGSTVAVGTSGSPPYLVDLEDRTWTRLAAPTDEADWRFEFADGQVFATHAEHADAWVSDDRGASWSRLPH